MNTPKCGYIVAIFLPSILIIEASQTQVCTKEKPITEEKCLPGPDNFFYNFLCSNRLWVDRSLLIENIWRDNRTIFLISAPRRWSRTVNLRMLQAFFSIIEDERQPQPTNKSFAYNYFANGVIQDYKDNAIKIHPLPLIHQHEDIIKTALGQFPVIYVNFEGLTYDDRLDRLFWCMKNTFQYYSEHFEAVMRNEHITFGLYKSALKCRNIAVLDTIDTYELTSSLQLLSEVLHAYYGKKVIILLDEYDQFIRDAYFAYNAHRTKDFYQQFTERSFYSNKHLEKAVIASVLPVAEALGFSSTDNFREYNLIDGDDMYEYFGFTTEDASTIMEFFHVPDYRQEEARQWYGGYSCVNSPSGYIFPPYAITKFICEDGDEMQNYMPLCIAVVFVFKLRKYPVFRDTIRSLIQNKTYDMEYKKIKRLNDEQCRLINFFVLDDLITEDSFQREHCDIAMAFLYGMGYLTVDQSFSDCGKNATHIRVKAPNEQVRLDMRLKLRGVVHTIH